MNESISSNKPYKEYVGVHAIIAYLFTVILVFIDEGAYNFNWIYNWGNWVVYFIYVLGIFTGQILSQHFLFKKLPTFLRILLSLVVGGSIGLITVILLFTKVL